MSVVATKSCTPTYKDIEQKTRKTQVMSFTAKKTQNKLKKGQKVHDQSSARRATIHPSLRVVKITYNKQYNKH